MGIIQRLVLVKEEIIRHLPQRPMPAFGTQGTSRAREYFPGRMIQIDHYDFLWFCEDKSNDRAKKAKIEEEHYHEQPRNKK